MPASDASADITVMVAKPCWKKPASQWKKLIQSVALETLRQSRWPHGGEMNILLTDDAAVQHLNKIHLGRDKPTNVLSFPSLPAEVISGLYTMQKTQTPLILGDVALAFETIHQESLAQKKTFEHHLLHLAAHGILHLLGFDHIQDEDALLMESLEIKILSSLMIPNPYQE